MKYRHIGPRTIRVQAGTFVRGDECALTADEASNLLRMGVVEPMPDASSRRERAARDKGKDQGTDQE